MTGTFEIGVFLHLKIAELGFSHVQLTVLIINLCSYSFFSVTVKTSGLCLDVGTPPLIFNFDL